VTTAGKRIHALVHGRVQGVFFRDSTREQARRLGLTGWVRNTAAGSVETEFQGGAEQVAAMLDWLSTGSPMSLVTAVVHREVDVCDGQDVFEIRF
jgi:acylphosphatase